MIAPKYVPHGDTKSVYYFDNMPGVSTLGVRVQVWVDKSPQGMVKMFARETNGGSFRTSVAVPVMSALETLSAFNVFLPFDYDTHKPIF